MSELPGLPPAPRGRVDPLDGGVGAARDSGRRRLRRAGLGAALAVSLIASAAVATPYLTDDTPDSLVADGTSTPAPTPTATTSAPPSVGGPDPQAVEICQSPGDCRTIDDTEQATWLRDAMSTAQPATGQRLCGASSVYIVQFSHPSVRYIPRELSPGCGTMRPQRRPASPEQLVDPLVIARVVRAHESGTVDAPAFPRGASALSLCDGADVTSCQAPGSQADRDRLAVLLSAGGPQRGGDSCGEIGQPTVKVVAGYVAGAASDRVVRAAAGTRCGPLETSDGRRFALTEQARLRLRAVLVPPEQPPTAGTASCTWRPPRASAGDRAGDVPEPSGSATRTDRTATLRTNRGEIGLQLLGTRAPCTVHNLAHLAQEGYFDGTRCHRVTTKDIFVVQCGDPTGAGSGNPGYEFDDEALEGSTYPRGTLAMANAGEGTNGSQFFMVWKDSELPPLYTVFGRVDAAGLAVLDEVAAGGATEASDGPPALELTITGVTLS